MSTYNIREKFIYALATSSIEYIRNYNFNTSTITDIPLALGNTDTEIPITVNITTTVPWIQIVNPTTGANLKFPSGNVVLGPTSTSVVLVKVDLPPEIENVPSSSHLADLPRNYVCITDKTTFQTWVHKIQDAALTCIDTETTVFLTGA